MDIKSLLGLGFVGSLFAHIPWSLLFILLQWTNVRVYTLKNRDDCKRIQKRMTNSTYLSDDGKRSGYSIGKWYILSMNVEPSMDGDGDKYTVLIISTLASYEELIRTPKPIPADHIEELKDTIKIWRRFGGFYSPYFKKQEISIKNVIPRKEQSDIIEVIKQYHEKHEHTVAFIYGEPGTGKSVIAVLLAKEFNGSYCNIMHPWTPGVTLYQLYEEVQPTADSPLIILFDEIDVALLKIHVGVVEHKCLTTEVSGKTGWNKLFDEIDLGLYPNLIVIMTSNKTPEFIDSLDTCYIRHGRTNIIRSLENIS